MARRTIVLREEIRFEPGVLPGSNGKSPQPQRSTTAQAVADPLPDDVKHVRGGVYQVDAGSKIITVVDGKIVLRRSGKSRQWARYLVGKVADALRTAIEVFLGYPSPEEIRAWLEKLPGGAAARAALLAWFEKLVDRVAPARLFAAVGLLDSLGRPALPVPAGV